MNPPDSSIELRALCDRLLDGEFTHEDRARLESLVLGDAAMRTLYVSLMHQHAALRQSASRLGAAPWMNCCATFPRRRLAMSSGFLSSFAG